MRRLAATGIRHARSSACESQPLQRGRWFVAFKLGDRLFLASLFYGSARGRIAEREGFLQQREVVRDARFEPGVLKKIRRELRLRGGHRDYFGVTPVELGHAFSRVETVHTLRVKKENENAALLRGKRLAVHGDGGGRLDASLPHRGRAVRDQRKYGDGEKHHQGAT